MCSPHCPESLQETEVPRRCWSHYRSNLCTAAPAETREASSSSSSSSAAAAAAAADGFNCLYVHLCENWWSWSALPPLCDNLSILCTQIRDFCVNTLPFSGRTIDWEWLSCCFTSCWELWKWASALLNPIVLRVSEEAARCMLFTGGGVKSQGQIFLGQWWKGTDKTRGRDMTVLLCEHAPIVVLHLQILSDSWRSFVLF